MLIRLVLVVVAAALVAGGWFGWNYSRHDREKAEIDDAVRRGAAGQFVKTPLGTIHYELAGPATARTIVLVHGFSVPYYLWDPTFQTLAAAGYRVLRYDLFGRGLSDRPDVTYNGDLYDRQLTELLDALAIRGPVDIAGCSLGGPIVAAFACRHPERIRTVSFFDPGFSHGQRMPWKIRTPVIGEYTLAVDIAPGLPEGQMADFAHPEKFPEWSSRYLPQMGYRGFRRALLSTLRDYLPEDWSKSYACVGSGKAPVFLVWGKADRDVPFEVSRDVLGTIPRARFLPVEDAAHVPFLEHPEIVEPAFLKFLLEN